MSQVSSKSSMLLLQTKLVHPQLPLALVPRERLLGDLDAVSAHRLLLLSASAGSGKTTLLSTWVTHARASARKVAWLSLDASDNDPTRFWASVIAALRTYLPAIGETALPMLHTPQPTPIQTTLAILINEILEQGSEVILVLDDYQMIEDQAIHEALTFLLDHLPVNLHLLLASRVDPDLPLSRWRMRGQMLEIRDPDLSFTQEETNSFLIQALGSPFSMEEVNLLQDRTKGWIAGLQLATLALRRREDRATFLQTFTGSHRYLMDYVQQEILKQQPLPLQQFLLQIAVLPRLNADLCQAVTGEPDSQKLLESLERNNLFLIPLDEQRQWYRFHDLFREVLLARLSATHAEHVSLVWLRAAHWYEAQGEMREAVAHALAAADFSYATSLLERAAEDIWLYGETQTLYHWIIALPDAVVRDHARLVLTVAYYLVTSFASTAAAQQTRVRVQVEQMMARVEGVLRPQGNETQLSEEMALLQQRLRLLSAWMLLFEATTTGDVKFLHLSAQAMPNVEKEDEIIWQMIPYFSRFVLYYTFLREGGVLVPELQEMKQRVSREKNRYATLKVTQWLALTYVRAGQLHLAYQECLASQVLLQQIEGHVILAGYGDWGLADVLYQWNRLEQVRTLAQEMIHDGAVWQQIELQCGGYVFSAKYALAVMDLEMAHQALQGMERLLQQERWKAFWAPWITTVQVRYWLATGNLVAASDWAAHVVFHTENWDPRRKVAFLTLIHVYCAQQRYTWAIEMLERFSAYLDLPGDIFDTIGFLALSLVALHHVGKHAQARSIAARLFALTEPEGFLRVYLDEGEPMRRVLQALLNAPVEDSTFSHSYVSVLLAAFEQEEQRQTKTADAPLAHPQEMLPLLPQNTSALAQAALNEPLSPQELRVLRLLVAGRSNPEIASALVVSVNTVKTHLQSMYRKLGVTNRVEASAAARNLHLL
ncbi:MAG: LuxR C-terminal-related transcriptional regulator [Chloroflexota bacterium]|nr:LuxR C-terminal-related transcriptional regulator [Chloroflexota bacterium]